MAAVRFVHRLTAARDGKKRHHLFLIVIPPNVRLGNAILDNLPEPAKAALRPALQRIFLQRRDDAGQRKWSGGLLFPIDALLHASLRTEAGGSITLMAMGRRSAVGVSAWLGERMPPELRVLESGYAWLLPPSADREHYEALLGRSLVSWLYRSMMVSAYRLACKVEHNVDRRLAGSLLWIADETGRPQVSLTHQTLSELTAMRRPSVSLVLSELQRRGIVRSVHGAIGIIDRHRLEGAACACYESTRAIMRTTAQAASTSASASSTSRGSISASPGSTTGA